MARPGPIRSTEMLPPGYVSNWSGEGVCWWLGGLTLQYHAQVHIMVAVLEGEGAGVTEWRGMVLVQSCTVLALAP